MKTVNKIALGALALASYFGVCAAAVYNLPVQRDDFKKFRDGSTESLCTNVVPVSGGDLREIWAETKNGGVKMGWMRNAVVGAEAKTTPDKALAAARQFCATGTTILPDGAVVTAPPYPAQANKPGVQ